VISPPSNRPTQQLHYYDDLNNSTLLHLDDDDDVDDPNQAAAGRRYSTQPFQKMDIIFTIANPLTEGRKRSSTLILLPSLSLSQVVWEEERKKD